jgi:hypothetical protein
MFWAEYINGDFPAIVVFNGKLPYPWLQSMFAGLLDIRAGDARLWLNYCHGPAVALAAVRKRRTTNVDTSRIEISNFRSEISSGILFAAVAGVGGGFAGIAHRGAAAADRDFSKTFRTAKARQRIHPQTETKF